MLCNVVLDQADTVLVTPDWKGTEWRDLLDELTIRCVPLPELPLYIPEGKHNPIAKPKWNSLISYVSGKKPGVTRDIIPGAIAKWLAKQNKGWGRPELEGWMADNAPTMITGVGVVEAEAPQHSVHLDESAKVPSSRPWSAIKGPEDLKELHYFEHNTNTPSFYRDMMYQEVDHPFAAQEQETLFGPC